MKIGNVSVARGEFKRGPLAYIELVGGLKIEIPMLVMMGKKDGPTCVITALVHGNEVVATGAVHSLFWNELKPSELKGTLVAFPVSNPLAFLHAEFAAPQDRMNLSIQDFFNANPHGSSTERIAAHIGDVLKGSDYAIDIHGAGPAISMNFVISPHEYATDQQTRTKTIKMAESSGLTLTKFDPHVEVPGAGTRIQAPLGVSRGAVAHGIPGLTIELRNMNYLLEESITVGVKALKNVLKGIGMLDGIPEKIPGEPKLQGWYKSCDALKVKHGGIVRVLKEPGENIRKGDVIAKLYNVYGEEVEDVVMPVDGFFSTVLGGYGGRYAAIGEGEQVALIWEEISS